MTTHRRYIAFDRDMVPCHEWSRTDSTAAPRTFCPPLTPTVAEEMTVELALAGKQAKLRTQGAHYILDCVIAKTPREYIGKNLLDLVARAHHDAALAAIQEAA